MTFDASSRKDIRRLEKAAARVDSDRDAFIRAAMSTREGRVWFHHFMADLHLFSDPPTFDTNQDYYSRGERNVGLRIFAAIMRICPDQYILMEQEENVRVATINTAAERSRRENPGWDAQGRGDSPSDPDLFDDTGDEG